MKRIMTIVAVALTFVVHAKTEKVADLVLANPQKIANAASKLTQFAGKPELGMVAGLALQQANIADLEYGLGPVRAGSDIYVAIYAKDYDKKLSLETNGEKEVFSVYLVYPSTNGKAGLLAAKPDFKEVSSGVYKSDSDDCSIVFSKDGKDVCFILGNDFATAKKILANKLPKTSKSDIVRVTASDFAVDLLATALESLNNMGDNEIVSGKDLEMIRSISLFSLALAVSDAGVDIKTAYKAKPDSPLAKYGNTNLSSAAPLAFAGSDALLAYAYAANSTDIDFVASWKRLEALAQKWGFDLSRFNAKVSGSNLKFNVDFFALVGYAQSDAFKKACKKVSQNGQQVLGELSGCVVDKSIVPAEQGLAFGIAGYSNNVSAQNLFAVAFPKVRPSECVAVGVVTPYGAIKPILQLCSHFDARCKKLSTSLPSADGAVIATVCKKEGDRYTATIRITPAEIKGWVDFALKASALQECAGDSDDYEEDED